MLKPKRGRGATEIESAYQPARSRMRILCAYDEVALRSAFDHRPLRTSATMAMIARARTESAPGLQIASRNASLIHEFNST
jgi:hypothetical protein